MIRAATAWVAFALAAAAAPALAASGETVDLSIRGRNVPVTLYTPAPGMRIKGTVIIGSGDVGWVGLAVTVAESLREDGYVIAGLNVRRYLSAFTEGKDHVTVADVPPDYRVIADFLKARQLFRPPVVLSGVSEGAALAVAAGADATNHAWVDGVITMGLPASAELAWRWRDVPAWIIKRDPDEPSFAPADVIARVSPRPLWMIQSTRDEYVTEADYRRLEATAREPKRLILIAASNHRFTDRLPELQQQIRAGLAWIANGGR
jgi:alpha/beta superfamily hydrolase